MCSERVEFESYRQSHLQYHLGFGWRLRVAILRARESNLFSPPDTSNRRISCLYDLLSYISNLGRLNVRVSLTTVLVYAYTTDIDTNCCDTILKQMLLTPYTGMQILQRRLIAINDHGHTSADTVNRIPVQGDPFRARCELGGAVLEAPGC